MMKKIKKWSKKYKKHQWYGEIFLKKEEEEEEEEEEEDEMSRKREEDDGWE